MKQQKKLCNFITAIQIKAGFSGFYLYGNFILKTIEKPLYNKLIRPLKLKSF